MKKMKYIALVLTFCLIIGGISIWGIALKDGDVSAWERRKLQQFPELNASTLQSGEFMKDFETYLSDQFPLRDMFRRLKAIIHFDLFRQRDNSGIYIAEGHASKFEGKLNEELVDVFSDKMTAIYKKYIENTDCKTYYSIIPDKNYFLSEKNGYPAYDYDELFSAVDGKLGYMTKIEIADLLEISDYYTTDTHWKQEEIIPVAERIRSAMGMKNGVSYEALPVAVPFNGVYYGQSALPLESDQIKILTNEELERCTVYNAETDKTTEVYDLSKLDSPDLYDIFLSGAVSYMEITNPAVKGERELVVFRDSFGSSLTPLLLSGYSKVTLIDTRYIMPELIGQYISFNNQDVLFIYSTMLINASNALK